MQVTGKSRLHGLYVRINNIFLQWTAWTLSHFQKISHRVQDVVLEHFSERQQRTIKYNEGKTGQPVVFISIRFKGRQQCPGIHHGIILPLGKGTQQCLPDMYHIKKRLQLN